MSGTARLVRALAMLAVSVPIALAQTAAPSSQMPDWQKKAGGHLEFEVASIHLGKPGVFTPPNFPMSNDDSYTSGPNETFIADFSLATYIEFAYKLRLSSDQRAAMLAKIPRWVLTDSYEIRAKAGASATKDQMRLMMQSLLADRFKLTVHFEAKEVPVFGLVLVTAGKLGPKLRPHSEGTPCDAPVQTFPYTCDSYGFHPTPDRTYVEGSRNTTMSLIATSLTSIPGVTLDRPVVDQTGLAGRYDFTLEWTPESDRVSNPIPDAIADLPGSTIQVSLKSQLGLKLVPTKAMLDDLVIDHVERPSGN